MYSFLSSIHISFLHRKILIFSKLRRNILDLDKTSETSTSYYFISFHVFSLEKYIKHTGWWKNTITNLQRNFNWIIYFVTESIIKYSAPKGEIRDENTNLEDISYDGVMEGNYQRDGLGQLIDGLYGDDDYQKQLQGENSGEK